MHVAAVFTAFVMVAIPAIILVAVWGFVMAMRVLRPEGPLPDLFDPAVRRQRTAAGESVPVGFREIHGEMGRHAEAVAVPGFARRPVPGEASVHDTGLALEPWMEDLWRRRN